MKKKLLFFALTLLISLGYSVNSSAQQTGYFKNQNMYVTIMNDTLHMTKDSSEKLVWTVGKFSSYATTISNGSKYIVASSSQNKFYLNGNSVNLYFVDTKTNKLVSSLTNGNSYYIIYKDGTNLYLVRNYKNSSGYYGYFERKQFDSTTSISGGNDYLANSSTMDANFKVKIRAERESVCAFTFEDAGSTPTPTPTTNQYYITTPDGQSFLNCGSGDTPALAVSGTKQAWTITPVSGSTNKYTITTEYKGSTYTLHLSAGDSRDNDNRSFTLAISPSGNVYTECSLYTIGSNRRLTSSAVNTTDNFALIFISGSSSYVLPNQGSFKETNNKNICGNDNKKPSVLDSGKDTNHSFKFVPVSTTTTYYGELTVAANDGDFGTVSVNPATSGTTVWSGSEETSAEKGSKELTIKAVPSTGYQFKEWQKGGVAISANAEYDYTFEFTSTTQNTPTKETLTAVFEAIPATTISLDPTSAVLKVDDQLTLTATIDPTSAPVEWTSDNTGIATVDQDGKVTAVAEGEATITVTSVGKPEVSASCTLNVIPETYPRTVTENKFGTICLPYDFSLQGDEGVKFYKLAYKSSVNVTIDGISAPAYIEAEEVNELKAGKPYIIYGTANKELSLELLGTAVQTPGKENGLVGIYKEINLEAEPTNCIIKDSKYYIVNSDNVWVASFHAYIDLSEVPEENADANPTTKNLVRFTSGDFLANGINLINDDNEFNINVNVNLNGQAVGAEYKGIVIMNGKKVLRR